MKYIGNYDHAKSSNHIQPNELQMKSFLSFPSQSSGAISVIDLDSLCGCKTVWILISWLHRKPADLDLHCFHKREWHFEKFMGTVPFLSGIRYSSCLNFL